MFTLICFPALYFQRGAKYTHWPPCWIHLGNDESSVNTLLHGWRCFTCNLAFAFRYGPQPVSPSLLWPLTTTRYFPPHNHYPGYFLFQVTSASFLPHSYAHFFIQQVYMSICTGLLPCDWLISCLCGQDKDKLTWWSRQVMVWGKKNHKRKQMNAKYKDKFLFFFSRGN